MPLTLLLADLPQLLEDLLREELGATDGVALIGDRQTDGDLTRAAREAGANIIVVTRDDPANLAEVDPLMARVAGLSVLAMTPAGDAAWLHRCWYEAIPLREFSAASMLAATQQTLDT